MYSFVVVKSQEDTWIVAAVKWIDLECIYDLDSLQEDLMVSANKMKTELIKNYEGELGDYNIEFDTEEKANKAKEYFDGILTAAILSKEEKKNAVKAIKKKQTSGVW